MTDQPPSRRIPLRLIVIVFATMFALLAVGYAFFLRPSYVEVFDNLRPADASAVVAQLDAKGIAYRLSGGGSTISVPADQADQARIAVAGSDVALKGGVGFELFNKSDMGLTDFAQRINYQRALQGELERTIMMMDEIENARVHLAMPERALFRSERTPAKAAVEIIAKPGRQVDDLRVVGIQRLIAFSVPDLSASDVVVLDENGHVLGQAQDTPAFLTPEAEARQAVERYYRARVRAALGSTLSGVEMDVKVVALGDPATMSATPATSDATIAVPPTATAAPGAAPSGPAAADKPVTPRRDFHLRIVASTSAPLNDEQRKQVRSAVSAAVALDEPAGDELDFQTGIAPAQAGESAAMSTATAARRIPDPAAVAPTDPVIPSHALLIVGGIALLGLIWLIRRPATVARLTAGERDAMVERIRAALRDEEPSHAA